MKTKRGYTLIELVCVMSIISLAGLCFFKCYTTYNVHKNNIYSEYCSNTIMIFINNAKQYCFYNNISGYIVFDIQNNTMIFCCSGRQLDRLKLPSGFAFNYLNVSNGKSTIYFDNFGFTSDACTIKYRDIRNVIHSITVNVGTAYVEVKS